MTDAFHGPNKVRHDTHKRAPAAGSAPPPNTPRLGMAVLLEVAALPLRRAEDGVDLAPRLREDGSVDHESSVPGIKGTKSHETY